MPRMRIITVNEQEAFNKPPPFDHRDRKKFFDFPKSLLAVAATMRNPDHQISFLVGPVGPKLRFWPTRRTLWEHRLRD